MCKQTAQLEEPNDTDSTAASRPFLRDKRCNTGDSVELQQPNRHRRKPLEEASLKGLLIVFTCVQSREIRFLPVSHCVWHDEFHRSVRLTNL